MGRFARTVAVLTWKNALLMKRRPKCQCFIFGTPIVLICVLTFIFKPLVDKNLHNKEYCERPLNGDGSSHSSDNCQWDGFTPLFVDDNSNFTKTLNLTQSTPFATISLDGKNSTEVIGCGFWSTLHLYVLNATSSQFDLVQDAQDFIMRGVSNETSIRGLFRPGESEGNQNIGLRYFRPRTISIRQVDTEADLREQYLNTSDGGGCFIAVDFTVPDVITIRPPFVPGGFAKHQLVHLSPRTWLTNEEQPRVNPITIQPPRSPSSGGSASSWGDLLGASPGYANHIFLAIQHGLAFATVNRSTFPNDDSKQRALRKVENLKLRRLPYPKWELNIWPTVILSACPWFLALPMMAAGSQLARDMVYDKERRIKPAMMMMGVQQKHHWLAWYLRGMLAAGGGLLVVAMICTSNNILPADFSVLLVYFLLSASAVVMMTFLISTFFTKASNAAFATFLILYCAFLPFQYGVAQDAQTGNELPSASTQRGICTIGPSCFGLGIFSLAAAETRGMHYSWGNIDDPPFPNQLSLGDVILMLLFDNVWVLILASYLEMVTVGEGSGVPLSPLFPLYWIIRTLCGGPKEADITVDTADVTFKGDQKNLQPLERGTEVGLETKGLTKVFCGRSGQPPNVAVNNVSLSMPKGAITALLGENGAGKTTTMSLLCGLFEQTSGTMIVNGRNVSDDREYMQSLVGVCPQHDILWDTLTVREHMTLVAWLKGVPTDRRQAAVAKMIGDLGLTEKANHYAKTLSGGQKRRLSCGMALIGDSSIVVLDEPTSGCDPKARRDIWDLLLRYKEDRTMLLSTHFMDEADLLGDRIAIMSTGKLVAEGTSDFLKSAFGTGYTITLAKQSGCDSKKILDMIQSYVPPASLKSDIGTELAVRLPKETVAKFPGMLRDLEKRKVELGIDTFGCTITTMEEVFLIASKLGSKAPGSSISKASVGVYEDEAEDEALLTLDAPANAYMDISVDESGLDEDSMPLLVTPSSEQHKVRRHRNGSLMRKIRALLYKRYLRLRDEPLLHFAQIILPLLLLSIHTYTNFATGAPDIAGTAPRTFGPPDGVVVTTGLASSLNETAYINHLPEHTNTNRTIENFVGNFTGSVLNFNTKYKVALSADSSGNTTAWFNGQYYHSMPDAHVTAINLLLADAGNSSKFRVRNLPMPETADEKGSSPSVSSQGFLFSLVALVAFTMWGCVAIYVPADEYAAAAKHMQFVSGVHYATYWIAFFLWDFSNSWIVIIETMLLSSIGSSAVWESDIAAAVFALLVLCFLAFCLQIYFFAQLCDNAASAVRLVLFSNIFLAEFPMIAAFIVRLIGYPDYADDVTYSVLWMPVFCGAQGMAYAADNYATLKSADELIDLGFCKSREECCNGRLACTTDYFSMEYPGIGRFMVGLIGCIVLYAALIALAEKKVLWQVKDKIMTKIRGPLMPADTETDEDVLREKNRLANGNSENDLITLNDVSKYFGRKRAVDGVSVGIPAQQCFGLLGVNGAGKSTLFKMLVGDHSIGSGKISIAGYDVATELPEVQSRIGYVPQFDALLGYMTGRQLLSFYAALKGVPRHRVKTAVGELIERLYLGRHADKPCRTYSGGNKRKLSVATALIGGAEIIFMDEPTTGMDPGSRRFLWDVILDLVKENRSIVLTTHSMEECEALCSRLTIMMNGRFQCLGSPQHLKDRFGSGYVVTLIGGDPSSGASNVDTLVSAFTGQFPSVQIEDQHLTTVTLKVDVDEQTSASISVADLFEMCERLKEDAGVVDYTCSQTSLEQIFLRYARADEDGDSSVQPVSAAGSASAGITGSINSSA